MRDEDQDQEDDQDQHQDQDQDQEQDWSSFFEVASPRCRQVKQQGMREMIKKMIRSRINIKMIYKGAGSGSVKLL